MDIRADIHVELSVLRTVQPGYLDLEQELFLEWTFSIFKATTSRIIERKTLLSIPWAWIGYPANVAKPKYLV